MRCSGRVERKGDTDFVKRYVAAEVDGTRYMGRPRKAWRVDVKDDMSSSCDSSRI